MTIVRMAGLLADRGSPESAGRRSVTESPPTSHVLDAEPSSRRRSSEAHRRRTSRCPATRRPAEASVNEVSPEKHGVSRLEAESAFHDPRVRLFEDRRYSSARETRYILDGRSLEARVLMVGFTHRGGRVGDHGAPRFPVLGGRSMRRKPRVSTRRRPEIRDYEYAGHVGHDSTSGRSPAESPDERPRGIVEQLDASRDVVTGTEPRVVLPMATRSPPPWAHVRSATRPLAASRSLPRRMTQADPD